MWLSQSGLLNNHRYKNKNKNNKTSSYNVIELEWIVKQSQIQKQEQQNILLQCDWVRVDC